MTIEECRQLNPGDKVKISLGNGWYQEATFEKLVEVVTFGKMTFADIKSFDPSKGRKKTEAIVVIRDDDGYERQQYVNPRKLKRGER
jgi:hypothetical protein